MSKAFFKPTAVPKLIHRYESFSNNERVIEIWTTTCIVTNFGKTTDAAYHILINPANPHLTGTSNFPYFPRGGPVPTEKPMSMHKDWQPLGHVSQWGGMEIGEKMVFPVSVVDGLVHQLGGWRLEAECALKRKLALAKGRYEGDPCCCPIGSAIETAAPGKLSCHYDAIIHTTPPFYKHDPHPEQNLRSCYRQALDLAFRKPSHASSSVRVAAPLLGAGARGFPESVAATIAAQSINEWLLKTEESPTANEQVLAFGLLEQRLAEELAIELDKN